MTQAIATGYRYKPFITSAPPPFFEEAACVGRAEIFFPEKGSGAFAAKRICAICPVQPTCLQYAIRTNQRFGVWGGTSERDRRRIVKEAQYGSW